MLHPPHWSTLSFLSLSPYYVHCPSHSCRFLVTLYSIRMLMFGAALFIAARPGLDNPGCYRNGWDYARGVFEGISLIIFLVKGYDEIRRMFQ